MLLVVGVFALPAIAAQPTTIAVDGYKTVDCGGVIYVGPGTGTVTFFDTPEDSRFTSQATFHILWEFTNTEDESDSFTYIDTGVAQIRFDGDVEIHSVSGHTTARPGDGALAYGRWVEVIGDYWVNQGHPTGCVAVF